MVKEGVSTMNAPSMNPSLTIRKKFWKKVASVVSVINLTFYPFLSSVTFLYPVKTSENQRFSDVFRGNRNVTLD